MVRSEYEDLQRSGNATFEKSDISVCGWIFHGLVQQKDQESTVEFSLYIYTYSIYTFYMFFVSNAHTHSGRRRWIMMMFFEPMFNGS